jgi:hypothetical protein
VLYVDTTARHGLDLLSELRKKCRYDFFFLNDVSFPEVSVAERTERAIRFLERYSPYSRPGRRSRLTSISRGLTRQ